MQRMTQYTLACLLALALLTVAPLAPLATALAANAVVSECTEASFDAALAAVQGGGGGTLSVDCSGTITFTGQKVITSDVTIVGAGAIFDGNDSTRLFQVNDGASLGLVGLTLQNGNAVAGAAIENHGTLTVTASTFSGNSASGSGGAGGAIRNFAGMLTVTASTFSTNSADFGGAIFNDGTLMVVTASTFSDNNSDLGGGAIYNTIDSMLTVAASTFNGNHSAYRGGAILNNSSLLMVTASTFSDNSADLSGGAIYNNLNSTLTVTASTFSGNSTEEFGGAIINTLSMLTVTASTFSGNSASTGGALWNGAAGALSISSSIVVNSPSGDNCFNGTTFTNTTFTSLGYNLSDDASCSLTSTGDLQGGSVTLNLGALQNNGGPTHTMLPESGSAALEAIPPADCVTLSSPTGQRGVPRPQATNCEIGAVELGQTPVQVFAAYNLGPVFVGETVAIVVIASGPVATTLTYEFDCDNDGIYELSQVDEPSAACTFEESGSQLVPVRVTDGTTSASDQTTVEVLIATPTINLVTLDPSEESNEGDEVELTTTFSNPAPSASHTCEIDWGDGTVEPGIVVEQDGEGLCEGSHVYAGEGEYIVTVTVCNGDACDENSINYMVRNVAPTIDSITTNSPVPQGNPATITVAASDPGVNDTLTYRFDCDDDGSYETAGAGNQGQCALDPAAATTTIGVQVSDDDGGLTTGSVEVSQTLTLCGNYFTGGLAMPSANGCPSGSVALTLPSAASTTLCINPYNGAMTWSPSGSCGPNLWTHVVPDDGPLSYCQHQWTGQLRHTWNGQCGAYETPGVIPG